MVTAGYWGAIFICSLLCYLGLASDAGDSACADASAHLRANGREMRRLYIPALQHAEVGKTITGRAGCMVTQAGWWTYEYCFGDYIRQFHAENGQVHDEYFIGLTGDALDSSSIANSKLVYRGGGQQRVAARIREQLGGNALDPHGDQYTYKCNEMLGKSLLTDKTNGVVAYTTMDGGSVCGSSGRRRRATVFFMCDATQQPDPSRRVPIFFDIAETEPCVYQVFVRGDNMCSMMGLQVPQQSDPATSAGGRRDHPRGTDGAATPAPKGGAASGSGDVQSVPADPQAEVFESLPQDAAEDGDANGGRPKGRSPYALGIDDPRYFEDSFIMSV